MGATVPAWAAQPLWELGLGAGLLRLPHYRGSDQYRNWLLPIPYFAYRGEFFSADREGAHARLLNTQALDLDLSADVSTPARSNDNRARAGLPDLAPALEIGPSANLRLARIGGGQLDLRLPLRAAIGINSRPHLIGWRAAPVVNWNCDWAGWELNLQAGPVAGNRAYNAYFYDVAPANVLADRPAYRSPGGAGGWTYTGTFSRRMGDFWLGAYAQADSLSGAVFRTSPLVKQGHNLSVGIGLSWIFAASGTLVPARP
jgi:outer membrane scaffolding protein for murein synthesis (MipA/OmpV family)